MKESNKLPLTLYFIASLCFGLTAVFTKLLIEHLTVIGILFFRFSFVVVTFPLVLILFKRKNFIKVDKKEFFSFFLLAFFLVVDMILFFQSLYYISVNKALFLFLTYPIIALVMARATLKEPITRTDVLSIVISFFGLFLIFKTEIEIGSNLLGEILVLLSAVFWSAYVIMNRHLSFKGRHFKQTFWLFLFGFIMMLPIFLVYGKPSSFLNLNSNAWLLLLLLGIFATLIPYTFISYAGKHVKSSTSSIILLIGPVLGIIISFVILNERPPFNVLIGGILILISAFISTKSKG